MKKQLLLSVLSLFALVACGGKTSETSSSSSESSSSVEEKGWSAEQKKIMSDHLYGEVLPYIDLGDEATIQYFDWIGELQVFGPDSLIVTSETLQSYAALYTTENGWENITDQYEGLPEEVYIFEKEIDEVKDSVKVQFFDRDTKTDQISKNGSGSFVLAAMGDIYFHTFPSDILDEQTAYWGSQVKVPVFPADSYVVPDPDQLDFLCFTNDDNPETTYKGILENAEFTVVSQNIDNGDDIYIGVSSDYIFAVGFAYIAEYQALEILVANLTM